MNSELLVSNNMWIPAHGLTKKEVFDFFQYLYAAATLSSAHIVIKCCLKNVFYISTNFKKSKW